MFLAVMQFYWPCFSKWILLVFQVDNYFYARMELCAEKLFIILVNKSIYGLGSQTSMWSTCIFLLSSPEGWWILGTDFQGKGDEAAVTERKLPNLFPKHVGGMRVLWGTRAAQF